MNGTPIAVRYWGRRAGPDVNFLRVGPDPSVFSLPLKNSIKVTLVYLDSKGRVRHTERQDIIELAHTLPRK
jgi:hypothetical protein